MKYYLIAGETSGDLHGANLMRALQEEDANAEFRFWGGDQMADVGGELVKHYSEHAYMGFQEVVANLGTIFSNIKLCKTDITSYAPDALILIDYPGFNLRIAKWAKDQGIKVCYYISPQVWAWNSGRVKRIKQIVDRMYVILPFEKEFYAKWDYNVEFVGHPLLDAIARMQPHKAFRQTASLDGRPVVAILPGSRKQEIRKMLPVMVEMSEQFPNHQFVVGVVGHVGEAFYRELVGHYPTVNYVTDQTYNLLQHADAALVTSGTATLETALFGVPEVVCYKGSPISYAIGRMLVNVEYISLVNLIMEKEVVKELIQGDFNTNTLALELNDLLNDEERQAQVREDYKELKTRLGGSGASQKTAKLIYTYLKEA
jgi:lipid-A-disaccharide synthase